MHKKSRRYPNFPFGRIFPFREKISGQNVMIRGSLNWVSIYGYHTVYIYIHMHIDPTWRWQLSPGKLNYLKERNCSPFSNRSDVHALLGADHALGTYAGLLRQCGHLAVLEILLMRVQFGWSGLRIIGKQLEHQGNVVAAGYQRPSSQRVDILFSFWMKGTLLC